MPFRTEFQMTIHLQLRPVFNKHPHQTEPTYFHAIGSTIQPHRPVNVMEIRKKTLFE